MSKGDKRRPTDEERYRRNWDVIFSAPPKIKRLRREKDELEKDELEKDTGENRE